MIRTSEQAEWKSFEAEVARCYRRLGFRVQTNLNVEGKEIDVLAEKYVSGLGKVTLAVECKHTKKSKVSNEAVIHHISVLQHLRDRGRVTAGTVVSNNGFSQQAQSIAEDSSFLELHTLGELQQQVFGVADSLNDYVAYYAGTPIHDSFISLSGKRRADTIDRVEDFIVDWAEDPKARLLALLGDFGAGKTTLIQRLKFRLAQDYVAGIGAQKPFLVSLRHYAELGSLDRLLHASLKHEFSQDFTLPAFWNAARNGEFVLLLDGFDEMSRQSSQEKRVADMLELAPLLCTSSRAVLTCRTAYFVSNQELSEAVAKANRDLLDSTVIEGEIGPPVELVEPSAPEADLQKRRKSLSEDIARDVLQHDPQPLSPGSFTVVALNELSPADVTKQLKIMDDQFQARAGCTAQNVIDFIEKVYDLKDLVRRPILFQMIITTILGKHIDPCADTSTMGPSDLYDVYTRMEFERDLRKGPSRELLPIELRREFAMAIALAMFDANKSAISYEEIAELSTDELVRLRKHGKDGCLLLDELVTDIQVCTFLTRDANDTFSFTHRSFMEYFAACHLAQEGRRGTLDRRLKARLSAEILYFIASLLRNDNRTRSTFERWLAQEAGGGETSANLLAALFMTGKPIGITARSRVRVDGLRFKQAHLQDCSLDDLTIHSCDVSQLVVEGGSVGLTVQVESRLRQARLSNCGCRLRLQGGVARGITLESAQLRVAHDGAGGIRELHGSRSRVYQERGETRGGELRDCELLLREHTMTDVDVIGGTIEKARESALVSCRVDDVDISGTGLELTDAQVSRCSFAVVGLELTGANVFNSDLQQCSRGRIRESTMRGSSVTLGTNSMEAGCALVECTVTGRWPAERLHAVGSTRMSDCKLVGVALAGTDLIEAKWTNCSGFTYAPMKKGGISEVHCGGVNDVLVINEREANRSPRRRWQLLGVCARSSRARQFVGAVARSFDVRFGDRENLANWLAKGKQLRAHYEAEKKAIDLGECRSACRTTLERWGKRLPKKGAGVAGCLRSLDLMIEEIEQYVEFLA
ncbi:MAG: restriction endonuclease [Planctomycetota bacterium]